MGYRTGEDHPARRRNCLAALDGMFHRADDAWKFVHIHASFGVPSQDVGWVYPQRDPPAGR